MQRGLCGVPVVLTCPRKMTCVHPYKPKIYITTVRFPHERPSSPTCLISPLPDNWPNDGLRPRRIERAPEAREIRRAPHRVRARLSLT
jgi:hypothetical protein